jgi:hypothetical protein
VKIKLILNIIKNVPFLQNDYGNNLKRFHKIF